MSALTLKLFPAIDIRGGKCVRLYQGDYDRETVYGDDPVAQAQQFESEGAPWIHVVDLDAARSGNPENRDTIASIASAVTVPVQTGGGVRSTDAAKALFDAGVARVVIGTAAIRNPALVEQLTGDHRVAVGLDARGTDIAVHGWEESSGQELIATARRFSDLGVDALVVTEIGRDGTLEGPDLAGLTAVLAATEVDVVASGGVGTLQDLVALAAVDAARPLAGAIVGRAIYEKKFTVREAVDVLSRGSLTDRAEQ